MGLQLIYRLITIEVIFMRTSDTYVRARIDTNTKERAADALEAMGLSISDAIRLLMTRVAAEHRLPLGPPGDNARWRRRFLPPATAGVARG